MKTLTTLTICLALLGLVGRAAADDKKDEKKDDTVAKLLGTWELVKADEMGAPIGALVTFTKDGKLIIAINVNGQEMKIEGTYKVDKGKIETEIKFGDQSMKDTDTITKLTGTDLELKDKDGKVSVLKKKTKQ